MSKDVEKSLNVEGLLTSSVCPASSNVYPDLIAATNGKEGAVVYMTDRAKFASAPLIILFPSMIAIISETVSIKYPNANRGEHRRTSSSPYRLTIRVHHHRDILLQV